MKLTRPINNREAMRVLLIITFITVSLCVGIWSYTHPAYNWDIIMYIGSAYHINISNLQAVHHYTYSILENSIPAVSFHDLINDGNPFRETVYANWRSFSQQFPFYTVKPLYVWIVYILWHLGVDIVRATYAISVFSYLIICTIILLWVTRSKGNSIASYIAITLFAVSPPMIELARYSTPDALSASLLLLSLYIRNNTKIECISELVLLTAVLARPDNVIVVVMILLYWLVTNNRSKVNVYKFIITATLAAIIYEVISRIAHSYSYPILFYNTFNHPLAYPAAHNNNLISVRSYITALTNGMSNLSYIPLTLMMLSLAFVLIFYLLHNWTNSIKKSFALITAGMLAFAIHFVLFPAIDDRFYVAEYLMMLMGITDIASRLLDKANL